MQTSAGDRFTADLPGMYTSSLLSLLLDDKDIGLCLCEAGIFRRSVHNVFVVGNGALEESKAAISD